MTVFAGTKIGDQLHNEHRATLDALYRLEGLIGARKPPVLDDATRALLAEVAEAMDQDVTSHFGFEEQYLFPVLLQAGAGFMVSMLTGEHAAIRPKADEVRTLCAQALAAGAFTQDGWDALRAAARDLIDLETFHIQKEEMGLLGALAQVLETDLDEELAAIRAGARG